MTHVVTDNCIGCRFTECVSVCPVECFHLGSEMVVIDPAICIDCGGCIPVCPVNAIVDEVNLEGDAREWIDKNRDRAAVLPLLIKQQDALPTAAARREALGL